VRALSSSDVNAYLRQISGADITAKDFRTWAGTVKAAMALRALDANASKKALRAVVAQVADALGNTVAVCRKCYIHPQVIAGFEAGTLSLRVPKRGRGGLSAAECAVLAYLRHTGRSQRRR
jgi:DNA topoisomerase-1